MDRIIRDLLQLEFESGRIITTRLDSNVKVKIIRQSGELTLSEPQFHRLSPILDKIDFLREDRNVIIHGIWTRALPQNVPLACSLRLRPSGLDEVVSEPFPNSRMQSILHENVLHPCDGGLLCLAIYLAIEV